MKTALQVFVRCCVVISLLTILVTRAEDEKLSAEYRSKLDAAQDDYDDEYNVDDDDEEEEEKVESADDDNSVSPKQRNFFGVIAGGAFGFGAARRAAQAARRHALAAALNVPYGVAAAGGIAARKGVKHTVKTATKNACARTPCLNGGTCYNYGGYIYVCRCPAEYTGRQCQNKKEKESSQTPSVGRVNLCTKEPCRNGGTCKNLKNIAYKCQCPTAYTGRKCQFPKLTCEDAPCKNGGVCEKAVGVYLYKCTCASGYTGRRCARQRGE